MGYLSRQPSSNDMPRASSGKSKWLEEDDVCDEIFLLLSGRASRCSKCQKAVLKKYLNSSSLCPDCKGAQSAGGGGGCGRPAVPEGGSGVVPRTGYEDEDESSSDYGGGGCGEDSDTE